MIRTLAPPSQKYLLLWLLNGTFFSLIFWAKYQLVGPWIGAFISLLILTILSKISLKQFFSIVVCHLMGFLIVCSIIFTYYISAGKLDDLISNYLFSRFSLSTENEWTNFAPMNAIDAATNTYGLYLFAVLLMILASITVWCLSSARLLNFKIKIFIFSGGVSCLILVCMAFLVRDSGSFGPKSLTPIVCFSIVGLIFLAKILMNKLSPLGNKFIFILKPIFFVSSFLVFFSLNFFLANAKIIYLWSTEANLEIVNDKEYTLYKNGPFYPEIFREYWDEHYSSYDFFTDDLILNFYFHKSPLLRYGFSPPNLQIHKLHMEELREKILGYEINAMSFSYPISAETNAPFPTESEIITSFIRANSDLGLDQFLREHFKIKTAVIKDSTLLYLLVFDSNKFLHFPYG
jgi:hypothetical protein